MLPSVFSVPTKLSPLRMCFALLLALPGLLPAMAWAQVGYTGAATAKKFGQQAIGSRSAAKTLSFSVTPGTTIGSIAVLTLGAPDLDFAYAPGSTCAAKEYSSSATCTVKVTFDPQAAGLRMGAVVFFSAAQTVLGSVSIYGIGTGPQIAYGPGAAMAVDIEGLLPSNTPSPSGVGVDGAGDLYIADSERNVVYDLQAGNRNWGITIDPTVNGKTLDGILGIAVDGAGNLFIADGGNSRVVEVPAGNGPAIAIDPNVGGEGFSTPSAVAVDGAGDLFIADAARSRVVEMPADGAPPLVIDPKVDGEQLSSPSGVAVDFDGNLFIADSGHSRVVEVPGDGSKSISLDPKVNGEGLDHPLGIAVDGTGNLFIADGGRSRVVEVPATGGEPFAIDPSADGVELGKTTCVATDSGGDLFIGDFGNSRVVEVPRSQPPDLYFLTPTPVFTTDTTDGEQLVQIVNVGNETLKITGLSYPANFPEAAGGPSPCTRSTTLDPGQKCDVTVEFHPKLAGWLNEFVTLTDDALNRAGAKQKIWEGGTGLIVAPATHFSVTSTYSGPVQAGDIFYITVTALDSLGQATSNFNGTVNLTSSDPGFTNSGPITLSNGTGQGLAGLKTTGTQTITATDTSTPSLTGSGSFSVLPAPSGEVLYIGPAATQNFGAYALGSAAAARALSFSIPAGTTVGSIGVENQGTVNLDFAVAPGGTCAPGTFSKAATCTVNVTFKPKFAGLRLGSVVFFADANNSGLVLGRGPVYGAGTGQQIPDGFSSATIRASSQQQRVLYNPSALATDPAGDLYIANDGNQSYLELGAGAEYLTWPNEEGGPVAGIALDGAGDLYAMVVPTVPTCACLDMFPVGGASGESIGFEPGGIDLNQPTGLALDGLGDVFIADSGNNRVATLNPVGIVGVVAPPTVDGKGLNHPNAVAFDGAENLFILDSGNNRVVEVPAGGGAPTAIDIAVSGSAASSARGLALDGAGNLFIVEGLSTVTNEPLIVEVPAGGSATALASSLFPNESGLAAQGVAVDGHGNLFISEFGVVSGVASSQVVELQRTEPAATSRSAATNRALVRPNGNP